MEYALHHPEIRLQKLRGELLGMLASAPGGMEVTKLGSHYQHLYGRKLILAEYGLRRNQELLTVLGDSVCMEMLDRKKVLRLMSYKGQRVPDHTQQGAVGEEGHVGNRKRTEAPARSKGEYPCYVSRFLYRDVLY